MKLTDLVRRRVVRETELSLKTKEFEKFRDEAVAEITRLKAEEAVVKKGYDLEKIRLAQTVIRISGNPYAETDDVRRGAKTIAEYAIQDLVSGCEILKKTYFGNKRYDGYYQYDCHDYGYGPTHGSTVDYIGLKTSNELTEEGVDAAIYYIMVYNELDQDIKNDGK